MQIIKKFFNILWCVIKFIIGVPIVIVLHIASVKGPYDYYSDL